jgi:hypothetical protein
MGKYTQVEKMWQEQGKNLRKKRRKKIRGIYTKKETNRTDIDVNKTK